MFERNFEFTVYHPIEVCEERILDMAKYGCFPQPVFRVSAHVEPVKRGSLSEIYLYLPPRPRGRFKVEVEGTIEQVSSDRVKVSGLASVRGFPIVLLWWTSIGLFYILLALYQQQSQLLCLTLASGICLFTSWLQIIYHRNRLIKRLENALTQPKKKKL